MTRDERICELKGILSFRVVSKSNVYENRDFIWNGSLGILNPNVGWNIQKIRNV